MYCIIFNFSAASHNSIDSSHNSADTSHDRADMSHNSTDNSHNSADTSHNSADTSHNRADTSHNSADTSQNRADRSHNSTDRVVGWSSTVSSYVVFSCIVLSLTSQPHHITTLTVHITVLIHHITGLTGHITALTVHITVLIHHIIALTELLVDRLLFRLILSMSWIIFNLSASSSSIQDWNNKTHGLVNTLPFFLDQQCQCCFLFASYCVLHEKYIILPSNFWTWNKIFSSIFLNQFYLIFVNL